MIGAVLSRMESLGLLRPGAQVNCNVFVKLENVLIDMFDDTGRYYYVRVAETYDLAAEFEIARSVADRLGRFVPQPLCFFRDGDVSCIVFEGVDFQVVSGGDLMGASRGSHLARSLLDFLAATVRALSQPGSLEELDALVRSIDHRFDGTEQEGLWRRVRGGVDLGRLASLPRQPQHGDFVPNNFGIRKSGLVVFDWEDFGKVTLPGLDLAVLLASCVDFEPDALCQIRDSEIRVSSSSVVWMSDACRALGLDTTLFWRSVPFYLITFLCLKDRYSPAIRAKVGRAIEGLL